MDKNVEKFIKREEWFKFKEERTKLRLAERLKESEIEVVERKYD